MLKLFDLLLEAGANVNSVSSWPNATNDSLIHVPSVLVKPRMIKDLQKTNFDFAKFMNFRNGQGRTPFLQYCFAGDKHHGCAVKEAFHDFMQVWKKYSHRSCNQLNGFETDNDGNNGLHLLVDTSSVFKLQYILKNVFFPSNNKKNQNAITVLNQQNNNGDTPVHMALKPTPMGKFKEISADMVKLLLKYDNTAAKIYNKQGYLPIHVACIKNKWEALALLIQQSLYGKPGDGINETTNDANSRTALELSIMNKHSKCVQVLCKNKFIYIDDMSFYNAIKSNDSEILKDLLKAILNRDNVYDWKSLDTSKSITADFLQRLIECSSDNGSTNKCVKFLKTLIENGIKKQDYVYIALSLNYNLSSIKLNAKNFPNITVTVNANHNETKDHAVASHMGNLDDSSDVMEDSKQEIIEPWIVKQELGTGAFGQVKLGINRYNKNEKVALKFINVVNIPTQFVLGEMAIVQEIDHSNVIMLMGFNLNIYDNGKTVLIVFEYAPYGELFDLLKFQHHFSVDLSYHCFKQILSAIVTCHGMNIIHRDLKPQNILIGKNFKIKVADFGLSKTLNENKNANSKNNKKYIVGTPGYMAPELFKENDIKQGSDDEKEENIYNKACDIFSLSIILWQMLNGYDSKPFNTCEKNDYVYKLIIDKKYNLFWNCKYHENNIQFLENDYNRFNNNKLIQDLFEKMFEFYPMKRIKAKDIEYHAWIVDMHSNERLLPQATYEGELQHLHRQTHDKIVKKIDSTGSLYSNSTKKTHNSGNNRLKVLHSDTQPSNESSVEFSTLSEAMRQLKNTNNNENKNDNN